MPDVTICVPTWQAEPFIGRTLQCARSQTYGDVRILVSVDQCDDSTVDVCLEHAREDERIEVIVQPERLGWSRNANALLDRVDTDLFFLYFHDDVLEPTYVEKLRAALLAEPDAISSHCDLKHFGDNEELHPGVRYDGPAAHRMLRWLVGPVKGTTLRSMTRRSALQAGLRFPEVGGDGFWRAYPYHVILAGLGPAAHVPEVLYWRWKREGSLTKTWRPDALETLVTGLRESADVCLDFISSLDLAPLDAAAVRYGLYLQWMGRLRGGEARLSPDGTLLESAQLHPAFGGMTESDDVVASQPDEVQVWIRDAEARLVQATARAERKLRRRAFA